MNSPQEGAGHDSTAARNDADKQLVAVCTYNERENLEPLLQEILKFVPATHVVVVDDNSPDGTGSLADELAARDPRIHVLHRPGKMGLGTAIVAGLRYAIEHDYNSVVVMDADFSHHPRHLPALFDCMQRADVGIGSRYVTGGGVKGWGLLRHAMSWGINGYARLLLGLRTRDNSGSYRCYRVSKLRELDFSRIRSRGYSIQEELLYRCRRVGCRFEEIPIVFEDRRYGQSKINWREAAAALWIILCLGLERLLCVPVRPDSG